MREQLNYSCQVLSMIPVKLLLDPESFSTAINGTLYIWIYWTRTSTFKSWDSFSSFFQIYQINQSHHFQTLQICSCLEFGIFYHFLFPRKWICETLSFSLSPRKWMPHSTFIVLIQWQTTNNIVNIVIFGIKHHYDTLLINTFCTGEVKIESPNNRESLLETHVQFHKNC